LLRLGRPSHGTLPATDSHGPLTRRWTVGPVLIAWVCARPASPSTGIQRRANGDTDGESCPNVVHGRAQCDANRDSSSNAARADWSHLLTR